LILRGSGVVWCAARRCLDPLRPARRIESVLRTTRPKCGERSDQLPSSRCRGRCDSGRRSGRVDNRNNRAVRRRRIDTRIGHSNNEPLAFSRRPRRANDRAFRCGVDQPPQRASVIRPVGLLVADLRERLVDPGRIERNPGRLGRRVVRVDDERIQYVARDGRQRRTIVGRRAAVCDT
jgi:hypothetical protein